MGTIRRAFVALAVLVGCSVASFGMAQTVLGPGQSITLSCSTASPVPTSSPTSSPTPSPVPTTSPSPTPTPACTPSVSGTTVPPAASITDSACNVWTLTPGGGNVFKNGAYAEGGGSQLLYYNATVYLFSNPWYKWNGSNGWISVGGDPRPAPSSTATPTATSTAAPTPVPSATPTSGPVTANFFVSPNGSSTSNGSQAAPATINRAETLAEGSTGKTICLEPGTYTLTANWNLGQADNGEKWLPCNGQGTATIDGGGANYIVANNVTGLVFEGFVIQHMTNGGNNQLSMDIGGCTNCAIRWNTFLNCVDNCLGGGGISGTLADSNTFNGMATGNTPSNGNINFAIAFNNGAPHNNTLSHNLCQNLPGGCTGFATANTVPEHDNIVTFNLSINILTGCNDCGGYYAYQANSGTQTGNQFTFNALYTDGNPTGSTKCIYEDDGSANTLIKGNVCASFNGHDHWPAETDIFIHTCSGCDTESNVLQVSPAAFSDVHFGGNFAGNAAFGYQGNAGQPMSGNIAKGNIIFSQSTWPGQQLWWINQSSGNANPSVSSNDYFAMSSASQPNFGFGDASPQFLNPNFANPAGNNYAVGNTALLNAISMAQIPGGQGPLPYAP